MIYELIISLHLIAILTIVIRKNQSKRIQFIEPDYVTQIKGFAIMLIIFAHLVQANFINLPLWRFTGAYGVAIFLLISGYGLTESYKKDSSLINYFIKRFKKVLLPFSIVTFSWIMLFNINLSPRDLILNLIGLSFKNPVDGSMWYISFILIWYSVFWIVFKLPIRDVLKILLIFLVAYVLKSQPFDYFTISENISFQYKLNTYMFPLGILISLYIPKFIEIMSTKVFNILILIINIGLILTYKTTFASILVDNNYGITCFIFALISLNVFIIFNSFGLKLRMLTFIGAISYEIYLFEDVFIGRFPLISVFKSKWQSLILYVFVVVALSYILKYTVKFLLSWNKQGLSRELDLTNDVMSKSI